MKQLFIESCYDGNCMHHAGNDIFMLKEYDKQVYNKTFDLMRRDIYFEQNYDWTNGQSELLRYYTKNKNELKKINGSLHKYLYKNDIYIHKIIENYSVASFIKIPQIFKIKINHARFINYDGNSKVLLMENENYFYLFEYYGS